VLPYNVVAATQEALRQRTDFLQQGQSLLLAVRITPTTVDPVTGLAAVRCPSCWDETLRQTTVPNDPTCLGVGWIIPVRGTGVPPQPVLGGLAGGQPVLQGLAAGAVAQQGGYLNAVALPDAFINANEDRTTWTAQGMASYSQDTAYVGPGGPFLKKGDLLIQTGPTLPHSRRYVIEDTDTPKTLGASILFYTYILEYRRPDNITYLAPPADRTGLAAGTWS